MYDIIIVGGGAAGCVLASRLTDRTELDVLLIEAGGSAQHPLVRHPIGVRWSVGHPAFDWNRPVEADASAGSRAAIWPAGRVLGGGSSINTMFYIWGHRRDFDQWKSLGATGWGWNDVTSAYRAIETCHLGTSASRGARGPIFIRSLADARHPIAEAFVSGLGRVAGLSVAEDFCSGDFETGVAYGQPNQRAGRRSAPALEYPGLDGKRPNLRVLLNTPVTGLTFEGLECVGVSAIVDGKKQMLRAKREVVLTAGALATPVLLQRAGIGGSEALASLGAPVRVLRSEVGQNLQDHSGVRLTYEARSPSLNVVLRHPSAALAAWRYLLGGGPLADFVSHASAYFLADETDPRSRVQLSLFPFGYRFDAGAVRLAKSSQAMLTMNLCWPSGRGTVRATSATGPAHSRISFPKIGAPRDIECLSMALEKVARWFETPPLRDAFPRRLEPQRLGSDEDRRTFIRSTIMPFYHGSGTCRMGSDDDAVVDPRLCVRGISRLRIADTSIMPQLVAANTNATAMMIGERAATFMIEDLCRD